MNSIDSANKEFYNTFADAFDFLPFGDQLTDIFKESTTQIRGHQLLEIGSGGGTFAAWLTKQGYAVTCIEPADKLAEKVRIKGINVHVCTLQQFESTETFDIVVAISSLIHIKKCELPSQIAKITALLKPGGLFFVSFLLGEKEGFEDPTKTGKIRYFSKYSEEELNHLITPYFETIKKNIVYVQKMEQTFVVMVLRSLFSCK